MRTKNIKKTENKKEEIMQQAFLLMAKKGIKEISMREIAQACGVTKPVLYYYFKDKEDLCSQMIGEQMQSSQQMLEEYLRRDESFEKILCFIISDYMRIDEDPLLISSFFIHLKSFGSASPVMAKQLEEFERNNFALLKKLLNEQYKKGYITLKARDMGLHLILANISHLILHNGCKDLQFKSDYVRTMAQMILRALDYKGEINK